MDWNDVRLILEIARAGSFSAAAAALSTSKPTISRRAAQLERDAKVRLFRRSPQGVTLSAAGNALVQQATRVEAEVLDFERLLRAVGQASERPVVVEMSEGVASFLMTPAILKQELGPLGIAVRKNGIELPPLKLVTTGSANPPADIFLRWTPHGSIPSLPGGDTVRKLTDVSFVPFFSTKYGTGRRTVNKFEELGRHTIITLNAYEWFHDDGWSEWHRLVADADSFKAEWTASVGHLIQEGSGVGLLPTYVPMYSEMILPLDVAAPPMLASLWMTCSEDNYKDPRVRKCFTKLGELFDAADWMLD